MSIEGKHAYRFRFLKSEEWKNVRIACLARDKGKCVICGIYDLSNDAHHISYPDNWWNTRAKHVRTLCRKCHDFVHEIMEKYPNHRWKIIKSKLKRQLDPNHILGYERAIIHGEEIANRKKYLTVFIAWRMHSLSRKPSLGVTRKTI